MKRLGLEECIYVYNQIMDATGGDPGIRDMRALESAMASPWQTFGGQGLYREIFEKAAMMAFFVSKNHPFLDGNKRSALAFSDLFLWKNGFELDYSQNQKVKLMMRLADGSLTKEQLVLEYKKSVRPLAK